MRTYRIRMEYNRWYVRIYADTTTGDCIDRHGPYDTLEAAEQVGRDTGLNNGDEG